MAANLRVLASSILLASALAAQQAAFTNSGGTISLGTDLVLTGSTVASPAGTYALDCPVTALPPGTYQAEWLCNGGSITIQSNDGTTTVSGAITSGTVIETASGGGRGNPTKYYYTFSGAFTGTMTVNGQATAVTGAMSEAASPTTSPLGTGSLSGGTTNVNAEYEPIYITDTYNYRIVRIDNMLGDNFTALGKHGAGTNQFKLPWGIFVDAAGKIYVTDSAACRVVQMDDMSGTNWTTLGHCGSGTHQFNNPTGIFVDASGKIYVADTGNNRIVRMNGIAGGHWVTFGSLGSGAGQFNAPSGIALDASGRIYVADGNNTRVVRVDNMAGKNWTAYGSPGQFSTLMAVTLDRTNRIYVADTYNNRIVRMDDMLGTNWTVLGGTTGGVAQFINPYGVNVDAYGTIYIADSRDYRIVMADDMTGAAWTTYGSGATPQFDSPTSIFAVPAVSQIGVPTYTADSLTFSDTVVGTPSASQSITMTNIGSAMLDITGIVPSGDYSESDNCGGALPVGQACTVHVTFIPTAGGTRTGSIAFNFAAAAAKTVSLTGIGTLVTVSPTALNFGTIPTSDRPTPLTVTVSNPGASAAGITSATLKAAAVYAMKNPCPSTLAPGTSCTITINFTPQTNKYYTGVLTITDASGTVQKVSITGTGGSN